LWNRLKRDFEVEFWEDSAFRKNLKEWLEGMVVALRAAEKLYYY